MGKHILKKPEMMNNINTARYNPNVIIAILISFAIYIVYLIASAIPQMIYVFIHLSQNPEMLQGSFGEIFNNVIEFLVSQDSILVSFYLMIILVLFVIIVVRFIEKRSLSTIGLCRERFALKYLKGFGIGTLLIIILIAPQLIAEWSSITYNGFRPLVLIFLLAFIIQTASEEIFFRGYLLTSIGHKIGMFWAVVLSSILFALIHIINGDATILGIVSIFFIGVFLGFYMIRTNNIWGAFGIHAAWNFIQGCFSRIDIGVISLDYSIVSINEVDNAQDFGIVGDPMQLISIALLIIVISIVLFAGKNKVVRKVEMQIDEKEDVLLDA